MSDEAMHVSILASTADSIRNRMQAIVPDIDWHVLVRHDAERHEDFFRIVGSLPLKGNVYFASSDIPAWLYDDLTSEHERVLAQVVIQRIADNLLCQRRMSQSPFEVS